MRELVDFRIAEHQARRFLSPEDGTVLGGDTRKLVLDTRDSLFARVGALDKQLKQQGSVFFLGWSLRRQYTKAELDAAEPWVSREGYDGADLCATRQQVGPRGRKGEVFRPAPLLLISPRLGRLLGQMKAKGFELERAHFA